MKQTDQSNQKKKRAELLAPGGSLQAMAGAIAAGADAVYMGGQLFGARAYADNPGEASLLEAIDLCHLHGRKLYLTVNTLLKEEELKGRLYDFLHPLYEQGLDAVLVQDLGVWSFLRREFPDLPLHASTQMSVQSVAGANFLKGLGAERIVLARELSLEEVEQIVRESGLEIECFIHGALCYSYSGQCLLSSMIGGRSGNRGRCAQPCRQPYQLLSMDGQPLSRKSAYLLSLKDLCSISFLPSLLEAGIYSFKIEGRMKRPEYTAGVVEIYRKYLDQALEGMQGADYEVTEEDWRSLMDLYNRGGFSSGYYFLRNHKTMLSPKRPNHAGTPGAKAVGKGAFEALEPLFAGDVLETDPRPGHQGAGLSLKHGAQTGERISLPGLKNLPKGTVLPRVRSEHLLSGIRARCLDQELKEKIKGKFTLREGQTAILELSCGKVRVQKQGEELPQRAQNRALTDQTVRKQLEKTGGTPFVFETLTVDLQEGLFLSLPALNELRRSALKALAQALIAGYRRSAKTGDGRDVFGAEQGRVKKKPSEKTYPAISCLGMQKEQIEACLSFEGVDRIYADSNIWLDEPSFGTARQQEEILRLCGRVHGAGKTCYLSLPGIWRADTRRRFFSLFSGEVCTAFDGFLLRCMDQLGDPLVCQRGRRLVSDYNLYGMNHLAIAALKEAGVEQITLPAELNAGELKQISAGEELMVYGRYQLMGSASCLQKSTGGCVHQSGWVQLKDRTGAQFPVCHHCGICVNEIYNALPLSLHREREAIKQLQVGSVRLSFTTETFPQVREVLRRWSLWAETQSSVQTTRGHFRRGIL